MKIILYDNRIFEIAMKREKFNAPCAFVTTINLQIFIACLHLRSMRRTRSREGKEKRACLRVVQANEQRWPRFQGRFGYYSLAPTYLAFSFVRIILPPRRILSCIVSSPG